MKTLHRVYKILYESTGPMFTKRYITPQFIALYHEASPEIRKNMIRAMLDEWDAEYAALAKVGLIDDSIFDMGKE